MKIFNKYIVASAITITGLLSCNQDVSVDDFTNGEADFSNYIALGDSLTAGFADGALYTSAQTNSFAAILAGELAKVGGGEFKQPMVEDENGGLLLGTTVIAKPKYIFNGTGPVRAEATPTTNVLNNVAGNGPYNNFGIPGAKTAHLLFDGYGSATNIATRKANPYYVRFSNPNTSILKQAVSQKPTFYTLWIGANEVLEYAINGGASGEITSAADFQTYFETIVESMQETGAKGVILNLPAIETIPYFNVVPYNALPMDASDAALVNISYRQYNGAVAQFAQAGLITADEAAKRTINFVEGQNAPVIIDSSLTPLRDSRTGSFIPSLRQVKEDEYLTLPAAGVLGTLANPSNSASVIGVGVPLQDEYVLDAMEIEEVQTAVKELNEVISTVASSNSIPLFDFNAYLTQTQNTGIKYQGATATVKFVTGGIFSLDGIHPTQKGSAIVANRVIETINSAYNANVPIVNVKDYPGVELP